MTTRVAIWAAVAVAGAIVTAEFAGWFSPFLRFVVRRAAGALPAGSRERYTEEWLGELAAAPGGPISQLVWALSLFTRRRFLARAASEDVSDLIALLAHAGALLTAADEAELAVQPWQLRAACARTEPEAFFPEKGGSTREAKRVCAACEVREECLSYALQHNERFGIWGGLSDRERRPLIG
jgi:WhiB family redox-sensing transcriptional regulator